MCERVRERETERDSAEETERQRKEETDRETGGGRRRKEKKKKTRVSPRELVHALGNEAQRYLEVLQGGGDI